jgi:hypothetical protein
MTEWQQRQLCPDGACIGVIGPDGTCKVCGRAAPNWGDERNRGLVDEPADEESSALPAEDDLDDDDDEDVADDDEDADAEAAPVAGNGEWDERKLCPDDSCIGVIGDGGTCKVCGKRAA